jgi:hypothetical protein
MMKSYDMNPRILIVATREPNFYSKMSDLEALMLVNDAENPFCFVEYTGPTNGSKETAQWLLDHKTEYDAIAVFDRTDLNSYSAAREIIEKTYSGPKILFRTFLDYAPQKGTYIFEIELPFRYQVFVARIQEHFNNMIKKT